MARSTKDYDRLIQSHLQHALINHPTDENSAFDNNAVDSRIEATPANLETLLNDGRYYLPSE